MRIADFELERYFARWEFAARHLLCASDVQGYGMRELLDLADDETRGLWEALRLGYTESTGHPLLRREIASLYATIEPDEVLTFAGAEEAIFCLLNVALEPGDHAIVTWPGYQSLYEVARAAGVEVTLHELHESDRWALDLDRLRRQLTPATRLIVVNLPHNPTGMLPDRATFEELAAIADEAGARLLVDEVYRGLEVDEADRLPAGADACRGGISLGVMSKAYAMAGVRIGWLASHDRELLARVAAFKDYTTICSAAPSEILSIIALRARDRVLRTVARDRGGKSGAARRLLRRLGRSVQLGPPARWIHRFPAPDRPGRQDRRLGRGVGRGGGRAAPAGVAVRPPRQPLPRRIRPDGSGRGARRAGGVRAQDPSLIIPSSGGDAAPQRRAARGARGTRAPGCVEMRQMIA